MELSVAILTGGASSRMGTNKAFLSVDQQPFIERIIKELSAYDDLFLSVDSAEKYAHLGVPMVEDTRHGIGPIEGIVQSLKYAKHAYVFIVAVDMPFLSREIPPFLASHLSPDFDVYFLQDDKGIHSLCSIYSKAVLPLLEQSIEDGFYKIRANLDPTRVKLIPLKDSGIDPALVQNVNTPEDYGQIKKEPLDD